MIVSLSRYKGFIWAAWSIGAVFYAYQYILRVMPSILLSDITEQFGISTAAFGQFSGIYYIGYSLAHLPIGILLDRFGPKRVMSGCILLSVLGLMPLLLADQWIYPVLGRFLTGVGSSAAILGLFKIIRMMFDEAKFARMLSFAAMIGLAGAIYGSGPVSFLRNQLGAQAVIEILAAAGVALALLSYWIIPHMKSSSSGTVLSDLREVLRNRRVLSVCFCAGLLVGPLEGFADVWGALFLKQVYGMDSAMAASLSSLIFVGMCFGAPVLSWIAHRLKDDLLTIIGSGFVMLVVFALLLMIPITPTLLSLGFILVGVACAYQILAIYKASTYVRDSIASITTALANMIIMAFGYVFHSVIGGLIQAEGGAQNSLALIKGVSVIPIALAAGCFGFLWLWMRDRKKRPASSIVRS